MSNHQAIVVDTYIVNDLVIRLHFHRVCRTILISLTNLLSHLEDTSGQRFLFKVCN
jgi:hypothetical protein